MSVAHDGRSAGAELWPPGQQLPVADRDHLPPAVGERHEELVRGMPHAPCQPSRRPVRASQARDQFGDELLAPEEVLGIVDLEGRQALVGADHGRLGELIVAARQPCAVAGGLQVDHVSGQLRLERSDLAAAGRRQPRRRIDAACRLAPCPFARRFVHAPGDAATRGEQRFDRDRVVVARGNVQAGHQPHGLSVERTERQRVARLQPRKRRGLLAGRQHERGHRRERRGARTCGQSTTRPGTSRPRATTSRSSQCPNASRLHRSAILGALACALLGTTTGVAAAQSTDDAAIARALAQERYYDPANTQDEPHHARSSHSPLPTAAQLQAMERHYSSYGEPEPIAAPVAAAPADGTPWLSIALTAAVALAAASLGAIHRRRLRLRRRVARATT